MGSYFLYWTTIQLLYLVVVLDQTHVLHESPPTALAPLRRSKTGRAAFGIVFDSYNALSSYIGMTVLDDLSGFEFEDVMEDVFRNLGYENVRQADPDMRDVIARS